MQIFFNGQKTAEKTAIILPKTKFALRQKTDDCTAIIDPKLNVYPAGQNKDNQTVTNFPNNDDNTATVVDGKLSNELDQEDFRNNNEYINNLEDWQRSNHMINSGKASLP